MNRIRSSRILLFLFFLLVFLISLRVDYRFTETINCCGDDHTYFVHAETISEDFDLDYSNQMDFVEGKVIMIEDKVKPIGFIGTGILAAPFMLLGIFIDNLFNFLNFKTSALMNYKLLLYSLAPIFYFFSSIYIFQKILSLLNIKYKTIYLMLIFFGSGLHYYAFERFSMTHVYEVFCVTFLIYLLLIFYKGDDVKNKIAGIIPYVFLITYLVRYSNYFIFLIPFWLTKMIKAKPPNQKLRLNKYFLLNSLVSIGLFSFITDNLYGRFTLNPIVVYNKESFPLVANYLTYSAERGNVVLDNLVILFRMFYTQEFGLIWFVPIIFASIIYLLLDIVKDFKTSALFNVYILISIGLPIGITLVWQSVGSAFGMRYIYAVLPISFLAYMSLSQKHNLKILNIYTIIFSSLSFLSVLYFETSVATSLSENEVLNSFGNYVRYAQPEYLSGFLNSILSFDSYFIIFGTSYLGASIIKIFSSIMGIDGFINFLSQFGINIDNADVIRIFNNIDLIDGHKFIFIIFFLSIFSYYFSKQVTKEYK